MRNIVDYDMNTKEAVLGDGSCIPFDQLTEEEVFFVRDMIIETIHKIYPELKPS